jgi:thiol reductant ABC exporter CydD subunit
VAAAVDAPRTRTPPVDRRLLADRAVRRVLAADAVAAVGTAVLLILQAGLLARIIVVGAAGGGTADLGPALVGLALVVAGRGVVTGLTEAVGQHGATAVKQDLRRRLLAAVLRSDGPDRTAGAVVTAATTGLDRLDPWFRSYLPALTAALVVPPVLLLWIVGLDPLSAVVLGVTLPLAPLFLALIGIDAGDRSRQQWLALQLLGGQLLEVVRGLPTLRLLGRAEEQASEVWGVADRLRDRTLAVLRIAFLSALVLELLAMLGTAVVAVLIGLRLVGGGMELEPALATLVLAPEVYFPLRRVGVAFHAAQEGVTAAVDVLDHLDEAAPRTATPTDADARGDIEVRGLTVHRPDRTGPVLDDVTVRFPAGRVTAVVGRSGAGKTTLLDVLVGRVRPTTGQVLAGGAVLADPAESAWRGQLAWAPQRPALSRGRLDELLRRTAPEARPDDVQAVAHEVALDPTGWPSGWDTTVGPGGRGLSGGERRRIGLARALVRQRTRGASLLVIDEPTSDLDEDTAAQIAAALRPDGVTTVVATHDPAIAAAADHLVVLDRGRVVATGAPTEVQDVLAGVMA